jgi:hemoglobin-like flavoprotein
MSTKFKTTRSVCFAFTDTSKNNLRTQQQSLPAGTLVWASATDNRNEIMIRVCGTLLTQIVQRHTIVEVEKDNANV